MKDSQVIIKGLTRIQANTLALLCENGKVGNLINEKLDTFDMESSDEADEWRKIEDTDASMDFDESDGDVSHEANFDI